MENFKFIVFSIIVLGLLGFAGYWAFTTIESGSVHVNTEQQKELEDKNIALEKQVADLQRQVSLLESEKEQQAQSVIDDTIPPTNTIVNNTTTPTTPVTTNPTKTPVSKYQTLINDLQKLVDANTFLKLKSQGVAVGTVQKFLNTYNNTSNKVDNDYGASTVTAMKNFQKAQGLTADGEAGVGTFKKMITWLKSK